MSILDAVKERLFPEPTTYRCGCGAEFESTKDVGDTRCPECGKIGEARPVTDEA